MLPITDAFPFSVCIRMRNGRKLFKANEPPGNVVVAAVVVVVEVVLVVDDDVDTGHIAIRIFVSRVLRFL